MNREIKFRAWDDKNMVYSNSFQDERNYSEYDYLRFFFETIRGDAPLMQFTGLLDKNGKEIYEEDVVSYPNPRCRGIVKFGSYEGGRYDTYEQGNGFYFHPIGSYDQDIHGLHSSPSLEVIGNVYQNPDLIK